MSSRAASMNNLHTTENADPSSQRYVLILVSVEYFVVYYLQSNIHLLLFAFVWFIVYSSGIASEDLDAQYCQLKCAPDSRKRLSKALQRLSQQQEEDRKH